MRSASLILNNTWQRRLCSPEMTYHSIDIIISHQHQFLCTYPYSLPIVNKSYCKYFHYHEMMRSIRCLLVCNEGFKATVMCGISNESARSPIFEYLNFSEGVLFSLAISRTKTQHKKPQFIAELGFGTPESDKCALIMMSRGISITLNK